MSSATDVEHFDPFSEEVVADPYPWYARLHAGRRAAHIPKWNIWVLSRHADVTAALRDHRLLSSADGVTFWRTALPMMLTTDPPDHERLRRIVGREFAPRDIERFRPAVERFVDEGMASMLADETADIVHHIAFPVPIRVMASILGVPESDIPYLRALSADLVEGFSLQPSSETTMRIPEAITGIHGYFSEMIAERRTNPAEDLVTKLMTPASDGVLTEPELLWFCLLLLVAGIETTTNLIGNMTIAFIENAGQWRLLRDSRELVASAVNEVLRYDAPIQGFYRAVTDDYRVEDDVIPPGARVLLAFGAANRDPVRYAEPDVLRVDRNPTDHVAFGAGIHRCLGAGLAELEGRIVLERLLDAAETLEPAGEIVRTSNPTLRGAKSLPLQTQGWRS